MVPYPPYCFGNGHTKGMTDNTSFGRDLMPLTITIQDDDQVDSLIISDQARTDLMPSTVPSERLAIVKGWVNTRIDAAIDNFQRQDRVQQLQAYRAANITEAT